MKKILSSKKLLVFLIVMVCMFGMIACAAQEEEVKYDLIPMVMVDGVIYADTGYTGTYKSNDDTYDREITSTVAGYEAPTENDQSNFGTGFKYRYGETEGTIEINMNHRCCIFATEEVRQQIKSSKS